MLTADEMREIESMVLLARPIAHDPGITRFGPDEPGTMSLEALEEEARRLREMGLNASVDEVEKDVAVSGRL
jgi:hypothetical protein